MSARRSVLSLFLAVLLAVRLASPFGFMPGEANGRFALVECPDAGFIPVVHHGGHRGMDHDGGAKAKPTCPFAASMAPAGPLPSAVSLEALPDWPSDPVIFSTIRSLPAGAHAAPRPPSRAPPRA